MLYRDNSHRFTSPSDRPFFWHYILSTVEPPYPYAETLTQTGDLRAAKYSVRPSCANARDAEVIPRGKFRTNWRDEQYER